MKKIICLSLFCLFFSSCSNYIAKMHREIDRDDRNQSKMVRSKSKDNLALVRKGRRKFKNPRRLSSRTASNHLPSVKRRYKAAPKRYKASDLNDNGPDGSLWSGQGRYNNFLFTTDEEKRNGDIIIIKVAGALKNDITRELKHAFPSRPTNKKEGEAAAKQNEEEETTEDPNKVHDRISSVVLEEVRKDHLLLRGRKELIYKKRKRQIEIQALISRRDVEMDDSITSDNIIEKNITILR